MRIYEFESKPPGLKIDDQTKPHTQSYQEIKDKKRPGLKEVRITPDDAGFGQVDPRQLIAEIIQCFPELAVIVEQGNAPGAIELIRDITDAQKRDEEMLRLRKALECASNAIIMTDAKGRDLIYHNQAFVKLSGYTQETLNAQGGAPRIFQDVSFALKVYNNIVSGQSWTDEMELITANGKKVPVTIHGDTVRDEAGKTIGLFGIFNDITVQKQVEMELRETQQRMANIIDFLPDATFVINQQGEVIAWNKAAEEMTGIKAEQMLGQKDYAYSIAFYGVRKPILIDLALRPDPEVESEYPVIKRHQNTLIGENHCPALREQGAYLRATTSTIYDSQGKVAGAIESIRDATEQKRSEEKMEFLSMYDVLTGLYNRACFEKEVQQCENRQCGPIGIILCDVDGLKLVNDTLGHKAGDQMLISAAQVLKKSFPQEVFIARVGGDEFSILLPFADIARLEEAVCDILREIEAYNQNNPSLPLSISLGYAFRKNDSVSIYELFKRADNNMYREKLGRSQSARSAIVKTLIKTLEARDFLTEEHAERLQDWLISLADEIGFPAARQHDLILFAQFHDIGKVGIPDRILFKPGPLTDEERLEMQRHSEIGHRIALAAPDLAPIADWILKHHEWWNGQGYPLGLKEKEIPIECRMLAIADAYDAMISNRPYRKALTHEEAISELIRWKNTQFDAYLVDKFIAVIEKKITLRNTTPMNQLIVN
jgi:diguanylate cyclase (GGDEF)-like protein/PAS domain S-box-containing protein